MVHKMRIALALLLLSACVESSDSLRNTDGHQFGVQKRPDREPVGSLTRRLAEGEAEGENRAKLVKVLGVIAAVIIPIGVEIARALDI